jgi:hypothetical protein
MDYLDGRIYIENGFEAKFCEVAIRESQPETPPFGVIDRCPGSIIILDEDQSERVIKGLANISLGGYEKHGITPTKADSIINDFLEEAKDYFPKKWEFEVY